MTICYIGLGSNQGDREGYLKLALEAISTLPEVTLLRVASLYETAPWGKEDQDWFINSVAEIETTLRPVALLEALLEIEGRLGRIRQERWGPRTIDLDLLLYGQQEISLPSLRVPHPLLAERAFVLVPLAELCPELLLPSGQTVWQLVENCGDNQELRKL